MRQFYTHPPLGQEIEAIAGHYMITAEKRLPFEGREVLYATGYMAVDRSCCGTTGCGFATVAGFLLGWKTSTSDEGAPVSEVEPIRDEATQKTLRRIITETEQVHQVNFLSDA